LKQVEDTLHALLTRARTGDNAAYRQFLGHAGVRLRAYFRRRLLDHPADVEDLVQETLLAIHNSRATWRPAQTVTAWLHAIARYKLIDALRFRSTRAAIDLPLGDDEAAESLADEAPEAGEARRDLLALLATLPDRYRLPIVHVKLEGLSVAETAARTGMSESAVKIGIHRGLRRLAREVRSAL
jgi:RNA polymerase sigma-70 factor (ECF subfamily)